MNCIHRTKATQFEAAFESRVHWAAIDGHGPWGFCSLIGGMGQPPASTQIPATSKLVTPVLKKKKKNTPKKQNKEKKP